MLSALVLITFVRVSLRKLISLSILKIDAIMHETRLCIGGESAMVDEQICGLLSLVTFEGLRLR